MAAPVARIIGLGKSGVAAARLLKHQGWQVAACDRGRSPGLATLRDALAAEGIDARLGQDFDPEAERQPDGTPIRPDLVVVSPGVPWDAPGPARSRALGIDTIGEMELAWRHLNRSPWTGITGTNGKTTTTALVAAIFQAAGLDAPACGNIGDAACDLAYTTATARPPRQPDWVVAEISSYQIESSRSLAPRLGLWTTFTPDHLNRHYTLDNYYNVKAALIDRAEIRILNGDDPNLRQTAPARWPDALWTSTKGKAHLPANPSRGTYVEDRWVVSGGQPVVPLSALQMAGAHNQQNLLMAVAAACQAGIDRAAIARAVAEFPGVPHRLERICTWDGIEFVNDSKATNYDAAQVGLSAVAGPVVLVAGGEAKAGDDIAWLKTIQSKAAAVLLIGSAAPAFAQRLDRLPYDRYEIAETLERAVPRAAALARSRGAKVVLLSPACASFDQFPNFEARGDRFRALCQKFVAEATGG